MSRSDAPSDEEVVGVLARSFETDAIEILHRRPYSYATSFPLEELSVRVGHERVPMILKDMTRARLLAAARDAKPDFLHEPRRATRTHRRILAESGVGAACYGVMEDPTSGRYWLALEKVPGVELWQVGDLEVWSEVARWLARFHARFAADLDGLRAANPFLLTYDEAGLLQWAERARRSLVASEDRRAVALLELLGSYDEVVQQLARLPVTFLHGEFVPSNVLVASGPEGARVFPVDWEMAALGPGVLDLAALCGGWGPSQRETFSSDYHRTASAAGAPVGAWADFRLDVERARLHLALQWIGWADGWRPPAEHARDWLAEATDAARTLRS